MRDIYIKRSKAFEEAVIFLRNYCEKKELSIDLIERSIKHKALESLKKGQFAPPKDSIPSKEECMNFANMLAMAPVLLINKNLPPIADHEKFIGECEIILPFPIMAFELSIESTRLIVISHQEQGLKPRYIYSMYSSEGFIVPLCVDFEENNTIQKQIETICILLDSGVAKKEVIRAPIKLNKKRNKSGKELIQDFYCISLLKRIRYSLTEGIRQKGVRLHFRRGHWRHYETHKTWVKWTLVGDEELGFVDKGYKL